jgi:uncharacterized membrane protein
VGRFRRALATAGEHLDAATAWIHRRPRLETSLVVALLVPAASLLLLLFYTVAQRMTYPLALPWRGS